MPTTRSAWRSEAGAAPAGVTAEARLAEQSVVVGGAVAGGLVGALAAGAVPGLGPVLAGGLLLGLLEAAAASGLFGLLVGLGVPEPWARASVQAVELGRTVVVVCAEGERLEEARDRLQADGPYELELTEQQTAPTCDWGPAVRQQLEAQPPRGQREGRRRQRSATLRGRLHRP